MKVRADRVAVRERLRASHTGNGDAEALSFALRAMRLDVIVLRPYMSCTWYARTT